MVEWTIPTTIIACYFNFIIGILSIMTTFIAIIAYFKSLTIRQSYQNLLLLNLLVNAIIFSTNQVIFYGHEVIMQNPNVLAIPWACNINGFLNLFCCGMEIYTLMCIALERYCAVKRQMPLSLNQIIGLLVFGWIEVGLITTVPFWASAYYYTPSDAIIFCTYPFSDHHQIQVSISGVIHVIFCIAVISFCYMKIYQFYRLARRRRHASENRKDSYLQSFVLKEDTRKKDEDNEFRVFLTTVLLIGWTLIGWTPMLVMIVYQVITGSPPGAIWDMISAVLLTATVCGDSIILLVYDRRWKASIREIMASIKIGIRKS